MSEADSPPRPFPARGLVFVALCLLGGLWNAGLLATWARLSAETDGPTWKSGFPVGTDFAQFAAAARAWETGQAAHFYRPEVQYALNREVTGYPPAGPVAWGDERNLAFNYPPFFLWPARLLVGLPYRTAFFVWTGLQLACAAGAVWFWRRDLTGRPAAFAAVLLAFVCAPPVGLHLFRGHAVFVGLLALSGCLSCLSRGRDFSAGLWLSVLLYKPMFGLILGPLLLLHGRWRAVAGVATGAAGLLVLSLAVAPAALAEWIAFVRVTAGYAAETPDFYRTHSCWLGFVASLIGRPTRTFGPAEWACVGVPVVVAVAGVAWAWLGPWRPGTPRFSAGLAAATVATVFVAPYSFPYDAVVLAAAGVQTARTLPLRPAWHGWALLACLAAAWAGWGLGGDAPFRPVPLALACWLALEVRAARTLPDEFLEAPP